MAGGDVPASLNTVVNDYVTGFPPTKRTKERRLGLPRWVDPAVATAVPQWVLRLAIAAMAFQAFFAMTHFGWQFRSEYGSFVLLIALLLVGGQPWRELAMQPVSRAVLLLAGFLVFQAAYVTWLSPVEPPVGYSNQLTTASKLVRLGVFSCFIGWWLSLVPRAIPYLFALMVLGLLSGVLIFMPWAELPAVLGGELRPRFGIPENLAGQLAAVAGWLAVCLMVAMWRQSGSRKHQATFALVCLLAYVGCFFALLFSQSRGAWLAFAVTLPAVMAGLWWMRRGSGRMTRVWPAIVVMLLSGIVLLAARDIVSRRLSSAEQLLKSETADETVVVRDGSAPKPHSPALAAPPAIAAGPVAAPAAASPGPVTAPVAPPISEPIAPAPAPSASAASAASATPDPALTVAGLAESSAPWAPAPAPASSTQPEVDVAVKAVNIRLQLYELGVEKWRERPWLGWGMRSTQALIGQANLDTGGVSHVHLHNAYLDAFVGIGLVGAGLLGLVFVLLMRELVLAWRSGVITTATLWVFAGCFGIVLVANAFDSLLWRFEYSRAPLEILFGCCIAYGLIRRRNSSSQ